MSPYRFKQQHNYRVVQLTDCHLLDTAVGWYQGCQPAQHLIRIVAQLQHTPPDALILTGDLTQDHTAASYHLLAELLSPLPCPIFLVPGNHDDPELLYALAEQRPFELASSLQLADWELFLLNTKGPTPAGYFLQQQADALQAQCQRSTAQHFWLFMHHHPSPLHCFIDQYGLIEPETLWQSVQQEPRIRGISHGHAHMAYQKTQAGITVVGCPATSVQFLKTADWQTCNQGPQWCEWLFQDAGQVSWQFKRI